ncbi:hypothetical protein KVR01_009408 [Diaporthe batatas]|uniref:uncharacterized protein n=1 Tax=Diaporthe batatas TaxID=748121 RepID=UPI001D0559B9|nr:uncharacterized protein KVR01_009408 [Diaporthe batatas]KAG8161144.1 hypothetical protein KVR01_009408 [Diaporthe batatas]
MPHTATSDGEDRPLLSDSRPRDETYGTEEAAGVPHDDEQPPQQQGQGGGFARNLGALDAFAIIISIVIGSGIFTSPGSIDTNVPSPGAALAVWLVGGVLAWTGAATMAELGTAIPGEGGVQPYLKYIYGDVFGHLAAWTWVVAVMPATLAILSIVFVESIFSAAGVTDRAASPWHKLLSVLIMVVMNLANSISTRASTRLNRFFVTTKFVSISAVVLAGLVVLAVRLARGPEGEVGGGDWARRGWFAARDTVAPDGSVITHWQDVGTWQLLGHLSAALYGALWAYSGWEKGIYVSAELSDPVAQLPLAINTAIPTIIACFLAANAAYYVLLPWDVVSTTDSVAVTAITRLLGRGFGIVAAILICLVVAGSLLGNSFVAGRMAVAAANADWLPPAFAELGHFGPNKPRRGDGDGNGDGNGDGDSDPSEGGSDAPLNAILLNTLVSAVFIFLGDFRSLLTFNGLGEYTFFFLTVLGAVVLRLREPGLRRPYKPLPVVPVIFTLVSGFVLVRGAVFAPVPALVLVAVWAVGVVFYVVRRRHAARARQVGGY